MSTASLLRLVPGAPRGAGTVASLAALLIATSGHAALVMDLSIGGATEAAVVAGSQFTIDVNVSSDAGDLFNSAIFRLEFSSPGLLYESYWWAAPFSTGSIFDQSKPGMGGLGTAITAATLAGPTYPAGIVDVELANAAVGSFSGGLLARLTVAIPEDFVAGPLTVSVVPDTMAKGLLEVETVAGDGLTIQILPIPAPATVAALLGMIGASGWAGRRRRTTA